MTECERLIKEGKLKKSFLMSEVRNDYQVTEDIKKLWAINLDLLITFSELCKNYHLRWYLFYGSLLGSIRHKGFIPWDDDIDIYMPREDYDRLISLGADVLGEPYFLQTPYSDPSFFFTTTRVRNSRTSYIDYPFKYQGFNQGIGIAIAPLDYLPMENVNELYEKIHSLIMDNAMYMRLKHTSLSQRDQARMDAYLARGGDKQDPLMIWERINKLAQGDKESGKYWIGVAHHYGLERSIFNIEDFEEVLEGDFEGLKFPIPKGYDRILKTIYGDYMKFPPTEERGTWHSNAVYNADVPYTDYLLRE